MSKHSKLAPSASERWLNCIGSVYLSSFLPKPKTNDAAEEGIFAHEIASIWLKKLKFKKSNQPVHIAEFLKGDFSLSELIKFKVKVTEHPLKDKIDIIEMEECVAFYADIVQSYMAPLSNTFELLIEHKVNMHKTVSGTADLILFDENNIIIIDFKYGRVPVSAKDNTQLMLYLYGFYLENRHKFHNFENLTLKQVIIQPRSNDNQAVSMYELGITDLLNLQLDLKKAIFLLNELESVPLNEFDPNTTIYYEGRNREILKKGAWCKYCPAISVCPKLHDDFKVLLQNNMFKLEWMPSPSALAEVLDFKPVFKKWADEIDKITILRNDLGEPLPQGYTVKPNFGHRKITNETELLKTLREKYPKISNSLFEPPKLKSPAQIEKIIGDEIKPILKEHCEKPFIGHKLTKMRK